MSFIVTFIDGVLTIPVQNQEDARMQYWADADVMIIDDDFVPVVIDILVPSFPLVSAGGRANPTQGDIRNGLGLVEVGQKWCASLIGGTIISCYVKGIGIKVGYLWAGI